MNRLDRAVKKNGKRGYRVPIPRSIVTTLRLTSGGRMFVSMCQHELTYSRFIRGMFDRSYLITGGNLSDTLYVTIPAIWGRLYGSGSRVAFEARGGDMIIRAIKED